MNISTFYDNFTGGNSVPVTILSISIMLLAGFLVTRITKKLRLPNVTAYIVAGIIIGPYCLNLIPRVFVESTGFLPDIALAFIAFGTGEYFKIEVLRKNGLRVIAITLFEALLATALVFLMCYVLFGLSLPFSMVLSALAAATAPASTMMTIRQTGAKGEFVDTLLQVVALDDIVGLIAYSVAVSIATASIAGSAVSVYGSLKPFLLNVAILVLGGIFGWFIYLFMRNRHSTDNRLIIAIAMMLTFCGIAAVFETSPLLGCMAMGAVYINLSDDDRLFKQLNYFNPPILLLFFVRSGISFDLKALFSTGKYGMHPLILVGVGYFIVRIAGKYFGAFLGCKIAGLSSKVQRYMGLALIPQAGVAIGLAELGARTLKGDTGNALLTIILASSVLYELIGPAAAKFALYKSRSYQPEDDATADALPKEKTLDFQKGDLAVAAGSNAAIRSNMSGADDVNAKATQTVEATDAQRTDANTDTNADTDTEKADFAETESEETGSEDEREKSGKDKENKGKEDKDGKNKEKNKDRVKQDKGKNKKSSKKKEPDRYENIEEQVFDEGAMEYYESQIKPEEDTKKKKNKKDKKEKPAKNQDKQKQKNKNKKDDK